MASLQKTVAWFNEELEKYIKKIQPPKVLHDSMQYSLLAGEKESAPFYYSQLSKRFGKTHPSDCR